MKTMSCKQLGGPCTLEFHGNTADEIIKQQDKHLKNSVKEGDAVHAEAAAAMSGRWRNPIKGMGWYKQVKKDFAALPQE